MPKRAPPFTFFFLHAATVWPPGVIALAMASQLVKGGVPVRHVATVAAASSLAFTFEFIWAPTVDSSLSRKWWYAIGAVAMCTCLLAMFMVPWNAQLVPVLTLLAFASCSGAAIAAVAAKGIMAGDVSAEKMPTAGGFYTAGGTFGRAAAGALAVLLLAHFSVRPIAGLFCLLPPIFAAGAILLASPVSVSSRGQFGAKLRGSLLDLWRFVRTRGGVLVALFCVLPFGTGTEAALMGAIAHEWSVSANQLALMSVLGSGTSIAGALLAGWIATRTDSWTAYLGSGLMMIAVMLAFAVAPRTPSMFIGIELLYRACATGNYAALLGIVMNAIGKGAVSTKAAVMWSLTNFAVFYALLIEGNVHDRYGTTAMLLTDSALGTAGLILVLTASRLLGSSAMPMRGGQARTASPLA